MNQAITESITQSQSTVENEVTGKVEKKSGKRIGYNYIVIKSYKESQKNDVVKCLYIKSLTDFGFCVIKEGSKGDTKDKNGRDIIDRLKWQKQLHEQLQDQVPMPRLLGHFEERGNYYLVIGHIKGKALQKVVAENRKELRNSLIHGGKLGMRFLNYLIQIATILQKLHEQKIVHRDATPNNYMITSAGKVALIDMEMCYSLNTLYPTPAFALGTYGYMSKQQEAISTPTTAEDIFALGAIILQLWSGIAPGKLTTEPIEALTRKISFFIPDQQIADIVTQCLLPEDDKRPNASKVLQVLKQYKVDLKAKATRPITQPILYSRDEIIATIQEGITTLATPLLADPEKGWFSDDMKPPPKDDKHKLRKAWYASYSHGASGILYFLAQAKRVGLDIDITAPYVQKALELIELKYIDRLESAKPGLHFGADGIAAVLSTAIREKLIVPSSESLEWIDLLLQKPAESIEIKSGMAGQGLANLCSQPLVSAENLQLRLQLYASTLIGKQDNDGCWVTGFYKQKYTKRKIRRVTKGFIDGMAGNIIFLLEYGHRFQHAESMQAAQKGLHWLIKNATHKKNTIHWRTSKDKELNDSASDGNAGISLCFIKGYKYFGEQVYRQYANAVLNGIGVNMIDTNISQRKGMAGLGEVYLEAYQIFREEKWLHRAGWIAQVIMQMKKQHPQYGVYWLVEHERQPVANFMLGNSGVLHFLLRYCHYGQIDFPLLP